MRESIFESINYYILIGGLFLLYLFYRIIKSLWCVDRFMTSAYSGRKHTWRSIQCNKSIPYSIFCLVCDDLMMPNIGLFCECCGLSACRKCRRVLDKKYKCKQIAWPSEKPFHHLWVNVGASHGISVDSSEEGLKRYFCSWCQRIKFSDESEVPDHEVCDFQKYKKIIIPPNCVTINKGVPVVTAPPIDDWEPLIIFANKKSGGNQSDEVLSLFRGLLNPIQVVDMSCVPPERVVGWLPARCRLLAAGGDGTVAWLLNTLYAMRRPEIPVAILPMGTGNDLSRSLGWGASCDSDINAQEIIKRVTQATEQPLDRWKITINPIRRRLGRSQSRTMFAYNYASVGVDALVALDFHRARNQFLYRYASRTVNYIAYAIMGANRALSDAGCEGLERRLRVWTAGGGDALPLPPLQALVLLNIKCWGAGVQLWGMGHEENFAEQSMSDGKLEVVGISSSFQIARLRCGLAEPYRLAQTSKIKIELTGSCAMQVDGEPWMQSAATILVEPSNQCTMLRPLRTVD